MSLEENNKRLADIKAKLTKKWTDLGMDTIHVDIPLPYSLFEQLSTIADSRGETPEETAVAMLEKEIKEINSNLEGEKE